MLQPPIFMTPEQRSTLLKFLASTHRNEFDRRRRYEWQTLITTLTLYVLIAAAVLKSETPLVLSEWQRLVVAALVAISAACSIIYLHYIHGANGKNKAIAQAAEDCLAAELGCQALNTELGLSRSDTSATPRCSCASNWSWYWQAIIIVVFAVASAMLVVTSAPGKAETPACAEACKCLIQAKGK